jgi:hypothetical protein
VPGPIFTAYARTANGVVGAFDAPRQLSFGHQHPQPVRHRPRRRQFGDRTVQRHQHVITFGEQVPGRHGAGTAATASTSAV